ncbi:MAG: autotransporter-associated beta strand repeat-containing protein [Thermoguttaceae bacterium]|nr:autotransporter-associated beta strand repeat-containing protein [Thermoguttaceae bacterium]
MNFTFRNAPLLAPVAALCLVALLTLSVNAEIIERAYNSTQEAVVGANDTLIIKGTGNDNTFSYNNYSGSGDVYFNPGGYSYFTTAIPDGYTNTKVFIAGNALGLQNSKTSSDVYGSGRILVLTNELPTTTGTTTVNEGTLFNANGSSPTYDNDIQIKGVGGLRVGWNLTMNVTGKISDYTDANGNVTPGKLILERDGNDIRLLNGANDYSGGTQIGGGNVTSGTGATTNTVYADGTPYGTGPISFGQDGSAIALNNHAITVAGFDGGTTGTVSGSDTLTISNGTNNFSAPVTINNVTNLNITGSGSQTVASADVTNLTISSGEMSFSGALNVPGNITIASGATLKMTGTGSSLNAGNQVNIQDGATLYFENAVPRNDNTDLAINIAQGGTLKFSETDTGDHNDNNSLVRNASKNVTITGDGNFVKTGTGKLFITNQSNGGKVAIVLSDKAVIDVQEGDLVNGGWSPDCWKTADNSAYNQATLNIGPKGTVDLWDGTLHVGGVTGDVDGDNHGLIMSKNNGKIIIGSGMTDASKTYVYNGDVSLSGGRDFIKEGKNTQVLAGTYIHSGNTTVNDGTLEFSGTAEIGAFILNGGAVNITDGTTTMKGSGNIANGATITVSDNANFVFDLGDGRQSQTSLDPLAVVGKMVLKTGNFSAINISNQTQLELAGGIVKNNGDVTESNNIADINTDVYLSADSRLMAGWTDGVINVNGVISGPAKLIMRNDSGTVYLNKTNTYTGGTQIGDEYNNGGIGRLVMGADNALGTGPISFGSNNSFLDMSTYSQVFNGIDNQNGSGGNFGGNSISNTANLLESPAFNAAEGTNFVYTGTLPTLSGTITKTGTGSQTIVSADVDAISVTEGTMGFSGALVADSVSIAPGATLKMTGTGSSFNVANPVNIQNGATLFFENAVPRNPENTSVNINIAEGGTLKFSETETADHLESNTLVDVEHSHLKTFITGDGNFVKTGTGKLFMYRNATFSGDNLSIVLSDKALIDVQEGDLVNGGWNANGWKKTDGDVTTYNQATLNIGPKGTVDLWDGTMYVGGITGDVDGENAGRIISKNNGHLVIGMGITDTARTDVYNGSVDLAANRSITKEGAATQKFTGTFSNLGTTNVNGGTLEFTGDTTLGPFNFANDGKINVTGGTLTFGAGVIITPNIPFNVDDSIVLVIDPGDEKVVAQRYTANDGPLNIAKKIIVKSGYFRTVNISDATALELDGGILQNNGDTTGTTTSNINTDIYLASDSSLMAGWSGRMNVSGVISGPGKLIIRDDSGTIYLNKSNTYEGGTQVGDNFNADQCGRIVAGAENVLGTGRLYFIKDNSFFDMAGYAQTIGGLGKDMSSNEVQYKGSVNNSGAETTLTLNVPEGETYNYTGSVANNVSIVKTGAGTQQFNLADGATFAKEILVSNGRLDMKEYYTGLLTVKSGGVFSPGNSIGTLNLTGDFNLDGGTLLMEIGGPTIADSDQLIINGNLLLNDGDIVLQFLSDMTPNAEFAVVLDANNSAELDVLSFVNSYYFSNLSYGLGDSGLWVLSGKVDPNAVPEPSTWALLILGALGLLYWRKRK